VASLASAVIGIIVVVVLIEAWPGLVEIGWWRFLADASWHPTSDEFNLVPIVAGTFLVAGGGLALATAFGLLSAIFCCFYAPKFLATLYTRLVELLAGVPSVVLGFWGILVLVPLVSSLGGPGTSLLAATLILAVMVLPTICLVATSSLRGVNEGIVSGARALGLSRWSVIAKVVIPAAKRGLLTSVILGAGRAVGETMAVMMVSGNVVQVPASVFEPVRTLAANLALEISYASNLHRSSLFVSAVVLTFIVLATICLVELLTPKAAHD